MAVQVPGVVITRAAAGDYHSLAVTEDGAVFAWGRGANGALGDGTTADANAPVRVSLPAAASDVSAGNGFSLALTTDGRVYAWGDDAYGELGNGTTSNMGSTTPVAVSFPSGVTVAQISAGEDFALARTTDRTTPVLVHLPRGTSIAQLAAGYYHALALTTAGGVLGWGENSTGDIGNGTTTTADTPVAVQLPAGVTVRQLGDGYYTTAALTSTGDVYGWGLNNYGTIGDGSQTVHNTPVRAAFPAGVVAGQVLARGNSELAVVRLSAPDRQSR